MSNQNYRLEEKNSKKIDVHLLYITEAKYEQDWHSLDIRIILPNCFLLPTEPENLQLRTSVSRSKKMI